jgi:hypothetical protein
MDLHELAILDDGYPLPWALGRGLHRNEDVIPLDRADLLARCA